MYDVQTGHVSYASKNIKRNNLLLGVLQTALIRAIAEARLTAGWDRVPVTHERMTMAAE